MKKKDVRAMTGDPMGKGEPIPKTAGSNRTPVGSGKVTEEKAPPVGVSVMIAERERTGGKEINQTSDKR
jgi:hypothetical protein